MTQIDPKRIADSLAEILEWCRIRSRIQAPGEGGERSFRGRLCEAFLEKTLKWPPQAILSGEKFDVTLLDSNDQPVITLETKEPGHITTDAEYHAFLNRLRRYPSLRHAFITNGSFWERYDFSRPLPGGETLSTSDFEDANPQSPGTLFADSSANEKLGRRFELILQRASELQVSKFFAPLDAEAYHDPHRPPPPGLFRHKLAKDRPEILEDFSASLRDRIGEFKELLSGLFPRLRSGELGAEAASVSDSLFQLWCERSYVVPPRTVLRNLAEEVARRQASVDGLIALLTNELGFGLEASAGVAEAFFAESRKKKTSEGKKLETIWPLYAEAIERYATQTAHVCAARLLLYRIGEDQGFFEKRISEESLRDLLNAKGSPLQIGPLRHSRILGEIEAIRSQMADFAPSIYEAGEFDWWRIVHPELLTESERDRLRLVEDDLGVTFEKLLNRLNLYDFSGLDLDIWRDVYQHYLPPEERQKLGGFYTPQELVDLTLDYAGYRSSSPKLCEQSLIDLAAGSGAFVVSALARLIEHLSNKNMPCHKTLHAREMRPWETADKMLEIIIKNIHAIDLHPFAAFLTYMNFLFVVLPLFAEVHRERKALRLGASIFSANSLLTPGENGGQRELDLRANSRIQLGRHAQERYREMAAKRFDLVVGNPPWGGILKGRLAPIFDENYKHQLEAEYRDTYTGKLDIYGLFYDRALSWLKSEGTVALITQGSFIDKEWAGPHTTSLSGERIEIKGLRRKLAEQASLRFLIDLNPFGQLFFGAMNIPCIAIFEKRPPRESESAVVLLSSKKPWPKGTKMAERRREAVQTVRHCLELVEKTHEPLKQDFASAFAFPLERLREFGGARWLLSPKRFTIRSRAEWPQLAQLLEPFQGVTVGGEGCLTIFLMTEGKVRELKLEKELVHPILKGHETKPWRVERKGNVILYPYAPGKSGKWQSAFTCDHPPVLDALDFKYCADKFEQDWVRQHGRSTMSLKRLLEHRRDALEMIKYPHAAEYLFQFYEQLSGRTFEKKNILDCGKQWYEFHRPREANVILGQPKIISPRLTPHVRFAIDQEGIAIQDSCICLAISDNTREAFEGFRKRLSKLAGKEMRSVTVFRYLLAFLNSQYSQQLLTTGHRPRPGDVFQISEEFLNELSIPAPKTQRNISRILDAVDACIIARADKARQAAEARLNPLVSALYSGN